MRRFLDLLLFIGCKVICGLENLVIFRGFSWVVIIMDFLLIGGKNEVMLMFLGFDGCLLMLLNISSYLVFLLR